MRRCGGHARPARRRRAGARGRNAREPRLHHRRCRPAHRRGFRRRSAAFITPVATWGRATKAASPTSATRPKAMRGNLRSKIGCRMICAVAFTSAASCGASSACGVLLERRDQLRPDQRRRDRDAMPFAARIRAQAGEGAFRRRAGTRRNGRRVFLRRAAPASGSTASIRRPESRTPSGATSVSRKLGRKRVRFDHAAPGHVAGIARREFGNDTAREPWNAARRPRPGDRRRRVSHRRTPR